MANAKVCKGEARRGKGTGAKAKKLQNSVDVMKDLLSGPNDETVPHHISLADLARRRSTLGFR